MENPDLRRDDAGNEYWICSKCGVRLTEADTIPCELAECPVTDEPLL